MHTFLVRRHDIGGAAAAFDEALMRLRAAEDGASGARWLHSYAVRDPAGRFGLACLVEAADVAAVLRHAADAQLPVDEIAPLVDTVVVKAFAGRRVYLVRRRSCYAGPATLRDAMEVGAAVARRECGGALSHLHSYVVREPDGLLGSLCFYLADGPDALLRHGAHAALPVDEVLPVLGQVVFRAAPPTIRKRSARAEDGAHPAAYDRLSPTLKGNMP